jgi:hypothetical protein
LCVKLGMVSMLKGASIAVQKWHHRLREKHLPVSTRCMLLTMRLLESGLCLSKGQHAQKGQARTSAFSPVKAISLIGRKRTLLHAIHSKLTLIHSFTSTSSLIVLSNSLFLKRISVFFSAPSLTNLQNDCAATEPGPSWCRHCRFPHTSMHC